MKKFLCILLLFVSNVCQSSDSTERQEFIDYLSAIRNIPFIAKTHTTETIYRTKGVPTEQLARSGKHLYLNNNNLYAICFYMEESKGTYLEVLAFNGFELFYYENYNKADTYDIQLFLDPLRPLPSDGAIMYNYVESPYERSGGDSSSCWLHGRFVGEPAKLWNRVITQTEESDFEYLGDLFPGKNYYRLSVDTDKARYSWMCEKDNGWKMIEMHQHFKNDYEVTRVSSDFDYLIHDGLYLPSQGKMSVELVSARTDILKVVEANVRYLEFPESIDASLFDSRPVPEGTTVVIFNEDGALKGEYVTDEMGDLAPFDMVSANEERILAGIVADFKDSEKNTSILPLRLSSDSSKVSIGIFVFSKVYLIPIALFILVALLVIVFLFRRHFRKVPKA